MATKKQLQEILDRLIGDADEQTQLFESSTQRLYKTLGGIPPIQQTNIIVKI